MKLMRIESDTRYPEPRAAGFRKHRTRLLAAAITIVIAAGAVAAVAGEPVEGAWHVGPTPDVRDICHAGDSLWVATGAGLFVVDIRDPSRVSHIEAGTELASNSVRAIAARNDSVWVATDAGLTLFRNGSANMFSARHRSRVPLRMLQGIAFGNSGEVLLATRYNGVGVMTSGRGYAITRRDSLIDDNVLGILERVDRPRLYACAAGLCAQVDDTTMVSFQAGAGLPRGAVRQVVGNAHTAYLRIARRGIYHFDGKQGTRITPPKGASFLDATSISLGADQALWVAGNGWVWVQRKGKWKRVEVPAEPWRVIVADGAGAFVGSASGVVLAVNRGADYRVSLDGGLPGPAVTSLRPDGNGTAWFVSGGHVVSANSADRKVSVEKSPVDAQAVDFSPAGDLIVASRWTVSRKSGDGWTDMSPDVRRSDPAFASVFADGRKVLWVGSRSGALYRYDGEIWLCYAKPRDERAPVRDARAFPGEDWALLGSAPMRDAAGDWIAFANWDSTEIVVDVAVNAAGEWFAATAKQILHYDAPNNNWTVMGTGRWKTPGAITSIAFDASDRLFVGTTDGFACVTRGKTNWWNVEDGIGGERVTDLAADATTLWIGYGDDGLSAIPLANLP